MKLNNFLIINLACVLILVKAPNFDQLRQSVSVTEQRAFIKLNVLLETAPRVVHNQLTLALPDTHLTEKSVYNWYNDFKDGKRTDIEDMPRSGRPRETTDEANKEWVKELILESDGMRFSDLMYETGIPRTSLQRILSELNAKKLKSPWCPHELTEVQKQARHAVAGKHLARYQREPGFLHKIIAIDETMLKSYDPEDERQTSEWLLPGQKP